MHFKYGFFDIYFLFFLNFQEYNLALWQCYGRYLEMFGDVNVEQITNVDTFKDIFFPDGFEAENAGLTVSDSTLLIKFSVSSEVRLITQFLNLACPWARG